MSVSGISHGSSSGSRASDKVDHAVAAVAKALRLHRAQAAAMVSLIEQASAGGDKGRHISVRA